MKKILMMVFLGLIFVMTPQVNAQAGSIDFGVENYTSLNEMEQITNVVIFIKFADETSYNAPFDLSHYDDLFNAVGSMSLRDYYLEVSYGELEINSIIVANGTEILFYQDIYDRAYYHPRKCYYNK